LSLLYDVNVCTSDYTEWHIYGMALTPNRINWYIDNHLIRSIENPGVETALWVEFGIVTEPNFSPTDPASFDVIHEVDYFRFYELNMDCDNIIDDCSFWFGGYENTVKKSIIIGGGGCSNTQPVGTNLILRAKEDVTINGDFEVPLGAELYIDANNCY